MKTWGISNIVKLHHYVGPDEKANFIVWFYFLFSETLWNALTITPSLFQIQILPTESSKFANLIRTNKINLLI